MDPVSIITLTGSVFSTGKVITSLITSLVTLKSKYKNASLIASLLIGQLTTIKTALNEVSDWIAKTLQGVDKNEQLIINLESSLESCHVFLLMLEDHITRLDQNGIDRQLKGKPRLLWNESEIKELNNYLNSQVNALHLLLTAVQRHVPAISNTKQSLAIKICCLNCVNKQNSRTSFDRNQLLQKPESQKVFKKVEDDRASISVFRSETSGSHIGFDFDREIATTNVYRNVTTSPEMTSNGSENTSLPFLKKRTGTKMGLSQDSMQRRPKLSSERTSEWCLGQTVSSDCNTNLPNSRPTSIDDKFSMMSISNDELWSTAFEWQSEKQKSSPDIIDNPFLDQDEGHTYLPIHNLHEDSSDTSTFHKNSEICSSSYQSLQILHYILLSGCSNSGKATVTDSIEFLSQNMTTDESWIFGKAVQSYILRCILHTVWEMRKCNVSSHWAEKYGLYNNGDFEDGPLVSHDVWSYKGSRYDHTPETIRCLAKDSWGDQGFRKTFDAWSSKNSRIKAAESYFRSGHRIWSSSYVPTREDLLLLFSRAKNMDIMWRDRIVKVYDYGGFGDHHLWKKREDVRVVIGPKTILYTISMMSSEFLKDADTCQPFVDLVHFEAACKPRYWTIPTCVILFTHLDEFMTSLESLTINRKDFKQYFRRFWGKHKDVWEVKSIVEDNIRKVASQQDRNVIVLFENSIDSKGETTDTVLDFMFQNSPNGRMNNELILAPNCL
ncbi:uncharacterized protein EAE98_008296 [Botrytis deweyae]|uniref:Fungal N-terminal domain-containing protein n=1 Tax=Botrytis deweyae TaxID=2478750 RepID=A0ABQ7IEZ6_9HELO|nr:uncharacterized protein EAE98_008296 [Botrytis deweyae]KAF7922085.1 hypothetical protein EAE98_008296 [Botrytis deweyae]